MQGIPPMFINRFGGRTWVGQTIYLESPTVEVWPVKVEEQRRRIYFTTGEEAFADRHVLEEGDFILFKVKGAHYFAALIFDNTCCECCQRCTSEDQESGLS